MFFNFIALFVYGPLLRSAVCVTLAVLIRNVRYIFANSSNSLAQLPISERQWYKSHVMKSKVQEIYSSFRP